MQCPLRLPLLRATGIAVAWLLAAGCAGPRVVVLVDEPGRQGWGERSPTWNWAGDAGPWIEVPADRIDDAGPRLAALVSAALGARGLVHTQSEPDVLVRYHLSIERTELVTYQQLPPRSITGSLVRGQYVVRAVAEVKRTYDDVRLEIHVTRAADGRPLWTARVRERTPSSDGRRLHDIVASVFERFPEAPSTTAARQNARDRRTARPRPRRRS